MLHTKTKGMIGEFAIAKDLAEKGFSVFREIGDLSKIDLIAEKESKLVRIQVKAITEKNGKITVYSKKNGPNYSFSYEDKMIDVFAIYVLNHDSIFYVSASELCQAKSALIFRWSDTKNGQKKNVRFWYDYTDFGRALRGHTPDTLASKVEGDEMVQTATT